MVTLSPERLVEHGIRLLEGGVEVPSEVETVASRLLGRSWGDAEGKPRVLCSFTYSLSCTETAGKGGHFSPSSPVQDMLSHVTGLWLRAGLGCFSSLWTGHLRLDDIPLRGSRPWVICLQDTAHLQAPGFIHLYVLLIHRCGILKHKFTNRKQKVLISNIFSWTWEDKHLGGNR